MARRPPSSGKSPFLRGKLPIEDARHMLRNEGGDLTLAEIAGRLATTLAVAGGAALALGRGEATAWHLALPMLAQYCVLLVATPLAYAVTHHPDLRRDAVNAMRLWAGFAAAAAIAVAVRASRGGVPWGEQAARDLRSAGTWIVSGGMAWPSLLAAVGLAAEFPGRVRNLYRYGPPFMGVGMGCAMRLVVLLAGLFVLPWAVQSPTRIAWSLWAGILLAELSAVGIHWDMQRKLREHDAQHSKNGTSR